MSGFLFPDVAESIDVRDLGDDGFRLTLDPTTREGNKPHLTGRMEIDGRTYRLAGWWKFSKERNVPYLSLSARTGRPAADSLSEAA